MHCLVMSVQCRRLGEKRQHARLLVSIVDSISACHAEDRGSIPRRGELVLFVFRTIHPKCLVGVAGHRRSSASTSARAKGHALAGNRTRVNCLEGSYAHHYTTNAVSSQQLAPSLRRLEVHESPIGLEEQMRSLFGPVTKESLQEFASRHVQESAAFPSG